MDHTLGHHPQEAYLGIYTCVCVHIRSFLSPHPTSTVQAPSAGTGHPGHPGRTVIPCGHQELGASHWLPACLPTSLLTSDLDPRESPSQCHANLLGWLPSSYPCLNRSPNNLIHYVGAGFLETGRKRKLSEPSESFFFKLTMGHLSPPQRGKLHCLRVF